MKIFTALYYSFDKSNKCNPLISIHGLHLGPKDSEADGIG